MVGFIKDYRKELDSDIWLMPPLYHRTWQCLKYKVNHDEAEIPMRDGTKFKIMPGQHLTSIRSIAKEIGWYEGRVWKEPNPKTIKTILDWLVKVRMIEVDTGTGNRQYTLITLINWHSYQAKEDRGNSKVTVGKQSADINKNVKNDKEEKPYINFLENVQMTQLEYDTLKGIMGEPELLAFMESYNAWIITQPPKKQKTASPYLSIRAWYKKAIAKTSKLNRTTSQLPEYIPDETRNEVYERALAERSNRNGTRGTAWDTDSAS